MPERTVPTPPQGDERPAPQESTRAQERHYAPPVDIFETPDGLTVVADLPGATRDNLTIEVKDDVLTLQARTQDHLPGHAIYREFQLVNFFRQFQLADTVDATKITAELKHGVLTLHLPKAEQAKPKRIEVKVS